MPKQSDIMSILSYDPLSGISWHGYSNLWQVHIRLSGARRVKYFKSLLDACAYRKSEELANNITVRQT